LKDIEASTEELGGPRYTCRGPPSATPDLSSSRTEGICDSASVDFNKFSQDRRGRAGRSHGSRTKSPGSASLRGAPPASHHEGPIFLNVRRHLDVPQAMALAFPKKVRVYVKDDDEAKNWDWPLQLQTKLGQECLQIRKVGN
jgi:hypothetical protein